MKLHMKFHMNRVLWNRGLQTYQYIYGENHGYVKFTKVGNFWVYTIRAIDPITFESSLVWGSTANFKSLALAKIHLKYNYLGVKQ